MASKYFYETYLTNEELGVSREIKAMSSRELRLKVAEQERKWAEQLGRRRGRERVQDMKLQAETMDEDAKKELEKYTHILTDTLSVNDAIDWDAMLRKDQYDSFRFSEIPPDEAGYLRKRSVTQPYFDAFAPTLKNYYEQFQVPKQSFWGDLFEHKKRLQKEAEAQEAYKAAMNQYEQICQQKYSEAKADYDNLLAQYNQRKESAQKKYNNEKEAFETEKKRHNDEVLLWKEQFENGDGVAVERYLGVVLANSRYPDAISAESEVFYDMVAKTAVVSFGLPSPDDLPQETGYKFVATRKAIDPVLMKAKDKAAYYENVIQQIALRTIHELFEAVYVKNVLETVVFNGWVSGIDKSTGQDFEACILSVQASRDEFEKFNLERIEPKECLRGLKALSAGPLQNLAPVKPIMDLNREDKRFITSADVLEGLEIGTNLATMPWEDFEHFVRELFEKLFSRSGGEVKVTQASRDEGVDAIAFDPDPIRGGKFVIQAKRYNNVVPFSACRDLYGTMISEGAVKGILVTTSYYGSDSRTFVKDKPITLIDGSNLVHMLNEYGYDFRINLKEQPK